MSLAEEHGRQGMQLPLLTKATLSVNSSNLPMWREEWKCLKPELHRRIRWLGQESSQVDLVETGRVNGSCQG